MVQIEEFQHIEMVIELDKGRSLEDVSEQFGVSLQYIRKLAREAGLITPQKKKWPRKRKALFQEDHGKIIERVVEGEELDSIALDFNISVKAVQQLCKREGVVIPRALHHVTAQERVEIKALLAANELVEEIARAYNLTATAIEQLQEAEYKQLDSETLGYLYEIITENKDMSSQSLKRIAKHEGYTISENAILSYQNRLKRLKRV